MDVIVYMVECHDGDIHRVRYFDAQGKSRTADFPKTELDSENIDYLALSKMIEAKEYNLLKHYKTERGAKNDDGR